MASQGRGKDRERGILKGKGGLDSLTGQTLTVVTLAVGDVRLIGDRKIAHACFIG
jgi:hypothetical protein